MSKDTTKDTTNKFTNKDTTNKFTNDKFTTDLTTKLKTDLKNDSISFVSNDAINDLVKKVLIQTDYTEDKAAAKLQEFNYDLMRVLKDYMGIPEKKVDNKIKSVNQEIYRQIRYSLDSSMKEYREKNPVNMDQIITNLTESEENEKAKKCK